MRKRSVGGARTARRILGLGRRSLLVWLDLAAAYQLLHALTALTKATDPPARPDGRLDTVVLIPAHDEATVIEPCLAALRAQEPPLPAERIIVIADNCTDSTADIARRSGVTLWERRNEVLRGKGHALAWAIDRIGHELPDVDVVGVVDADCTATAGLTAGWSAAIRAGAAAAQADYRVANPDASQAAARRWAGFALRHRVRGVAKQRLGLSCGLFGTGMAFSSSTLREVPWESFSVTEDAEYHVRLIERGRRVAFVADSAVLSDAPLTEAAARTQQTRWESGNVALVRESVGPLLLEGFRRRDPVRLAVAVDQLVPPQSILVAVLGSLGAVGWLGRRPLTVVGAAAGAAMEAAYVVLGLHAADAPATVWRSLATAPALIVVKLRQFLRIGAGRGAREWVKTDRP